MTNKEKAAAINIAVQGADTAAVSTLVKENYIQHTPVVPDGKKGLMALLSKIKNKEIPAPVIKNIRTFEDGEYVILHHDESARVLANILVLGNRDCDEQFAVEVATFTHHGSVAFWGA